MLERKRGCKDEKPKIVSEDIYQVCRRFGIRTVFKSGQKLGDRLIKVKYMLPDLS